MLRERVRGNDLFRLWIQDFKSENIAMHVATKWHTHSSFWGLVSRIVEAIAVTGDQAG